MKYKNDTLGFRLNSFRRRRSYTQDDFAEKLGVSVSTLIRYESDQTAPKAEVVARMALGLGISSDLLLRNDLDDQNAENLFSESEIMPKDKLQKNVISAINYYMKSK